MICLVNFTFNLILESEIKNLNPSDCSLENENNRSFLRLTKLNTKKLTVIEIFPSVENTHICRFYVIKCFPAFRHSTKQNSNYDTNMRNINKLKASVCE